MEDNQIETIKRLRLRQGDVVILKTQNIFSSQAIDSLSENIKDAFKGFPFQPKVILLEGGMDIEILSPDLHRENNEEHF